jgi:hypothetical protein
MPSVSWVDVRLDVDDELTAPDVVLIALPLSPSEPALSFRQRSMMTLIKKMRAKNLKITMGATYPNRPVVYPDD